MKVETFDLSQAASVLGLIVSVCMDCKQTYRTVDAEGVEGGVSHGICDPCAAVRMSAEVPDAEHPIHAYYREKQAAFKREWEKVTEAIRRGAPSREIEALKRAAERAGYTGD